VGYIVLYSVIVIFAIVGFHVARTALGRRKGREDMNAKTNSITLEARKRLKAATYGELTMAAGILAVFLALIQQIPTPIVVVADIILVSVMIVTGIKWQAELLRKERGGK
jgi:hypothetical protein